VAETNVTDLRDIVHELAQAQVRTEARVEELAQAQLRTEHEVTHLRRTVETQLGGLGASWGFRVSGTRHAFYAVSSSSSTWASWRSAVSNPSVNQP
jgi:hypothetical protein